MQKGYDTSKGNTCGLFGLDWAGMVNIQTLEDIAKEVGLAKTLELQDKKYSSNVSVKYLQKNKDK